MYNRVFRDYLDGMASNYPQPKLTVDCVIFEDGAVLLIRRGNEPFRGMYALPGGFVEVGETVEQACARETKEETGLRVEKLRLVGVYSDPGRDPRFHTVTVAFLGQADLSDLKAGSDAAEVDLVTDWHEVEIAFDHRQIIEDAWRLKRP
jgi:8-oxo-dGTP diphosphatase